MPVGVQERRARLLLRSVAGDEAADAYERLGCVPIEGGDGYGYLIYPHRPIVAFDRASGELLSEFCVRFTDEGGEGGRWLPDADDVLAKWLALRADERRLISEANVHRPGRQLDPAMVRRDIVDARALRGRSRRIDTRARDGAARLTKVAKPPATASEEI